MTHNHSTQPGGVDIPTAARTLGISPAAVRKRIRRRTLVAWKVDGGRWRVQVKGTQLSPGASQDGRATPAALDAYRQLAETLSTENAFLRGLVADQQATISRLTGGAAAGPAAIDAPTAGPSPDMPTAAPRRPWWRVWRRGKGTG